MSAVLKESDIKVDADEKQKDEFYHGITRCNNFAELLRYLQSDLKNFRAIHISAAFKKWADLFSDACTKPGLSRKDSTVVLREITLMEKHLKGKTYEDLIEKTTELKESLTPADFSVITGAICLIVVISVNRAYKIGFDKSIINNGLTKLGEMAYYVAIVHHQSDQAKPLIEKVAKFFTEHCKFRPYEMPISYLWTATALARVAPDSAFAGVMAKKISDSFSCFKFWEVDHYNKATCISKIAYIVSVVLPELQGSRQLIATIMAKSINTEPDILNDFDLQSLCWLGYALFKVNLKITDVKPLLIKIANIVDKRSLEGVDAEDLAKLVQALGTMLPEEPITQNLKKKIEEHILHLVLLKESAKASSVGAEKNRAKASALSSAESTSITSDQTQMSTIQLQNGNHYDQQSTFSFNQFNAYDVSSTPSVLQPVQSIQPPMLPYPDSYQTYSSTSAMAMVNAMPAPMQAPMPAMDSSMMVPSMIVPSMMNPSVMGSFPQSFGFLTVPAQQIPWIAPQPLIFTGGTQSSVTTYPQPAGGVGGGFPLSQYGSISRHSIKQEQRRQQRVQEIVSLQQQCQSLQMQMQNLALQRRSTPAVAPTPAPAPAPTPAASSAAASGSSSGARVSSRPVSESTSVRTVTIVKVSQKQDDRKKERLYKKQAHN